MPCHICVVNYFFENCNKKMSKISKFQNLIFDSRISGTLPTFNNEHKVYGLKASGKWRVIDCRNNNTFKSFKEWLSLSLIFKDGNKEQRIVLIRKDAGQLTEVAINIEDISDDD